MQIETIDLECGAQIQVEVDTTKSNDLLYYSVIDTDGETLLLEKESVYKKPWEDCKGYYKRKLETLLHEYGKLREPYVMFECNDRMYKLADLDNVDNHRKLIREVQPIGFYTEESYKINLITFGTLHSIFTYQKDILVFRFDQFYLNGEIIGTFDEVQKATDLSRTYIEYGDEKIIQHFNRKLFFKNKNKCQIAGYKSLFASMIFNEDRIKKYSHLSIV